MINSIKTVLSNKKYLAVFMVLSVAMFLLYVLLPVYLIPENNMKFNASTMPWWAYLLFALLSVCVGLLFSMQAFIFKKQKQFAVKGVLLGSSGGISGIVSSIFAGATCIGCVTALFGFLGSGTVLFLLDYRWEIAGLSLIITLAALYFSARRIQSKCEKC